MTKKTLLIAAVMFFGLSAAAYAQATFFIGSIPVTAVTASGNAEKTGDLTFTPLAGSQASNIGTFTISYGVPITVSAGDISVTGAGFTLNTGASNLPAGVIVLDVAALNPVGTGVITGVRVQVAGTTLTSLSVDVSATGNAIFNAGQPIKVINAISPGLSGMGYPFGGSAASINAVSPAPSYTTNINVTEGYLNAFGLVPGLGGDPTQTNSTWVKLTLSALPPKGVSIDFPTVADTTSVVGAFQSVDSSGAPMAYTITSTSLSLDVYYALASNTAVTVKESLKLPLTINVNTGFGGATLPLPAASVSIMATLAPLKPAFNPPGTFPSLPPEIPRYAEALVGPTTIFNIVPATTTMLLPYATTVLGFDTGIAIANTTTDPGAVAMGIPNGAVKQSGTIKFYFYSQDGSASTYTTATGSPGLGLVNGALPSGATYTVLLSELLAAAQAPADFNGYIVAIANFTNAHSQYFVTNFTDFANGSIGLVITDDRKAKSEALGQ